MTNRRVIIDTDPGLDDALAILHALNCGRFEVLGLTTMAGNIGIDNTTRNAGRLLAAMGRSDIPVITGAAGPLVRSVIDISDIHGSDGLHGLALPEPQTAPLDDAIAWMADLLLAEPAGSVDIFALGPLTNIAGLITQHPKAAARIGQIIAMGGAVDEPGNIGARSEFNFATDPEAADIVFRAGPDLTLVPLDVTRKVRADATWMNNLRGTTAGTIAADVIALYFGDGRQSRPLHDPCVMLLALDPSLFGVEERYLAVDLGDDGDAGALKPARTGTALLKVAMQVNAEGALDLLAKGLTRA
ncbi:Inosine-uridine preferring nucleoside hydrolase [Devosia sp. LC5]|uniref:nucleoside hydrolase n=1 Tax=Devosia sp. LC5 TaxID=1502724 RepID=UPI0004E31C82|nr:nucleoside hydrolase [Devosia sp. LC5]KFC66099.1 Inosine-uridine preferring nucleoside hydrolase [Devosia sp. LC5]